MKALSIALKARSGHRKDESMKIQEDVLATLRAGVETDNSRLVIEQERLKLEQERLKLEKIHSDFCRSQQHAMHTLLSSIQALNTRIEGAME